MFYSRIPIGEVCQQVMRKGSSQMKTVSLSCTYRSQAESETILWEALVIGSRDIAVDLCDRTSGAASDHGNQVCVIAISPASKI